MKRAAFISILILALPCYAVIVNIEADDYPLETPISDSFEFITLRAPYSGFEGEVVAVESSHSMQLLGEKVLGYSWDIEWWGSGRKFRISFDGFAKSLSVKMIGKEGSLKGVTVLDAYNANHELIISVNKKAQAGIVTFRSTERETYDIAYYELYSYRAIAFDDMTIDYQPVPEPATLLLLTLMTVCLRRFHV